MDESLVDELPDPDAPPPPVKSHETPPPAKKAIRRAIEHWLKEHQFVSKATPVLWYAHGTRDDEPYPALINDKADQPYSVSLTIFQVSPGSRSNTVFAVRDGVGHVDNPDYNGPDRNSVGAWDSPPWLKALIDLVQDARS